MSDVVLVDVNTKGTKELNELGNALGNVLKATDKALEDGWQAGQDVPVILAAALPGLLTAVEGLQNSVAELKGEPVKASVGVLVPVLEGVDSLLQKNQ